MTPAVKGSTTNERILLLEAGQEDMHADVKEIKDTLVHILGEISARPSWVTAKYITAVTSLSALLAGGIVTYILTHAR